MSSLFTPIARPTSAPAHITSIEPKKPETALQSILPDDFALVKLLRKANFPIFQGYSPSENKYFTMKIFPCEDTQPNKHFQNEIRFSHLQHSNIISYIYIDETASFSLEEREVPASCIVMENTPYGDLLKLIHDSHEHLSEKLARTYFRQLIEGIEYLHNEGVCHFDLSLDNLFIGEDGQLKIAGFDQSYIKGDDTKLSRGSEYYRAPELKSRRRNVGPEADIYTAGIILFLLKCKGVMPHMETTLFNNYDLLHLLNTDTQGFFEAHCEIQKMESSFFDSDFSELFVSMTKVNPEKRPTIREIKESKWYNGPIYDPKKQMRKLNKLSGF